MNAEPEQKLMHAFAGISAEVLRTIIEHSRTATPAQYEHVARLVAAGQASLQLRIDLGDEISTALWALDAAGEPMALVGTVVASGAPAVQ